MTAPIEFFFDVVSPFGWFAALRFFQNESRAFGITERYATLASYEKKVFAFVTKGLMNKQVAGEMNLSEITPLALTPRPRGAIRLAALKPRSSCKTVGAESQELRLNRFPNW
jgi:hypothetical protein